MVPETQDSNEVRPFLAEIMAHPADDAPRLIYADWLQERGDPRGEFIRVQCELAHTLPGAPRRSELTKRQTQLLRANRLEWMQEGLNAGVKDFEFVRGFIEVARTTVKDFVARHQEICRKIPLRSLTLTGTVGNGLLAECDSLLQLHTLVMLKNKMRQDDLSGLILSSFMANIEHWTCKYSPFPVEVTRNLAESESLGRLKTIDLSHAMLDDERLAPLVQCERFDQLEEANLSYNNHQGRCWETSPWRSLRHLDISYSEADSLGARAIARSQVLQGLESLIMSSNSHVTINGVAAIAQSQTACHLQNWNLRDCGIQGAALQHIFQSDSLPRLRALDLGGNNLTDEDVQVIAESPLLGQLDKLLLSHNRLTHEGVDAIINSPHFHSRTALFLRGNRLAREEVGDYRKRFGKSFGQFG